MGRTRFTIEFIDQETLDQFKALPKPQQKILGKAMKERLEINPVSFGKPLRYSLKGHRRLRVGDYRVVYRINKEKKIVTIIAVDHGKDELHKAYKAATKDEGQLEAKEWESTVSEDLKNNEKFP